MTGDKAKVQLWVHGVGSGPVYTWLSLGIHTATCKAWPRGALRTPGAETPGQTEADTEP